MTKCSFVAFLSVFVINLSLSYCNDDHNPKNKLRERFIPPLRKLLDWYYTSATGSPKSLDADFFNCLLQVQEEIMNITRSKEHEITSLKSNLQKTLDDAFVYSCLLGLRKKLDNIAEYDFPDWLVNCNYHRRIQWEIFFSVQPETTGQKKYQDRLNACGVTPSKIAQLIDLMYKSASDVIHPIDCFKFLKNRTLEELVPKCCELLKLQDEGDVACDALLVILKLQQQAEAIPFNITYWKTAKLIQIDNMDRQVSDIHIRACLEALPKKITHQIKINRISVKENSITVIEYFSDLFVGSDEIRVRLQQCEELDLAKRAKNQNEVQIIARVFEALKTKPQE